MKSLTRAHLATIVGRIETQNKRNLDQDDIFLYEETEKMFIKLLEKQAEFSQQEDRYALSKKEHFKRKDGGWVFEFLYDSLRNKFIITEIPDKNEFKKYMLGFVFRMRHVSFQLKLLS